MGMSKWKQVAKTKYDDDWVRMVVVEMEQSCQFGGNFLGGRIDRM